jgi:hypothetical protein
MDDTRPGRDGPDARSAPEAARIEELLVGGRTPLRGRSGLAGSRFRVIAYLLLIAAFGAEENSHVSGRAKIAGNLWRSGDASSRRWFNSAILKFNPLIISI